MPANAQVTLILSEFESRPNAAEELLPIDGRRFQHQVQISGVDVAIGEYRS